MNVRLEIKGTEPMAPDGTYVYDSGEIAGLGTRQLLEGVEAYVLKALDDLRALRVREA